MEIDKTLKGWRRMDEERPPKPGNYFVTYYSQIYEANDTGDLFWSGNKWEFKDDKEMKIVLPIIAWCHHPKPYEGAL